ncbi:aldo/keto reductase [Eoetvoesiella caeni]
MSFIDMNCHSPVLGASKLALGTAQFGLAYGVANRSGQVATVDVETILLQAAAAKIDTLDTAIAYGNSENVLGHAGVAGWRVVTKLPSVPLDVPNIADWVYGEVRASLGRLNIEQLDGLLLHQPADILGQRGSEYGEALQNLKADGLVAGVGFSIYDPIELERLWQAFKPDIVQAPLNVLDRRLIASGWLARLVAAGVRVHTRSTFLQGLLLMSKETRPQYFCRWNALLDGWFDWCKDLALSPQQVALGFVLAQPGIERIIIGVDSTAQLLALIDAERVRVTGLPDHIQSYDAALINPSNWVLN